MTMRLDKRSRLFAASGARAGFTLIEILAALVIFSVAVLSLLVCMTQSLSIQSDLDMQQRGGMLAENIIEEIRYTNDLTAGENEGKFPGADAAFDWWTGVKETETPGLMQVSVIVSWVENGADKEVRLETLMME